MTSETKYIHICEVCGRKEILTAEEGYEQGWDYLPMTSDFGIVMTRKCWSCSITKTAWWALCAENTLSIPRSGYHQSATGYRQ